MHILYLTRTYYEYYTHCEKTFSRSARLVNCHVTLYCGGAASQFHQCPHAQTSECVVRYDNTAVMII